MNSQPMSFSELNVVLHNDFTAFIERSFYELNPHLDLIPGKYIELLASTLDKCRTGQTKRLIINLPPRTLKSHAASVAFPAWLLGHDPAKQIICASYGQDLAEKHARDCRTLMQSAFYRSVFPRTVLSAEKQAVNDFMTTAQGFRMATSVGGVLTGRGGDVIILDDILKPEDALSDTRRKGANEWYLNTLLSRLNSKADGEIILVMQRFHQEDLVGEVMEREEWELLALPAIAKVDECYEITSPFGPSRFTRKPGESLHPERDPVDTYRKVREQIGEYWFECQYQQEPMPREGGLIKREWLKFYDRLPQQFAFILQSWDTASKSGEMNDFSVCTTWGLHNYQCYLIDVYRQRLTYPQLKRAAVDLCRRFNPNKILIEEKGSGISLIQDLQCEGVWGIEPFRPDPGTDKYLRLAAESIKFESGNVFLPMEAPWLEEYIRELTGFPGTKHDDQVDSTSQAIAALDAQARSQRFLQFAFGFRPYVRETW